ncbi:hypothetical protein DFJ73DRAFT_573823 [Zopfochytrium polystomum]|nr:hypothetical protein DFJ73DRAFT_573823 [Zopfochytrium polystomum]
MGSIAFFQQIHLFGLWSQEIFFKIADPERPSSASILASSFLNSANPIASLLCILAVAPRPYTVDVEVPKEVKKKTRDEPSFSENEMSDHESEEEEAGPQFETVLIDPSGFSSRSRELANDFASRSDGLSILRVLMDPRPSGVAEESIKSPYDFSANLFAQFRPEPIPEMQLDEVATASVLGLALQNGHLASVEYLVEAAKADIHASDENGCTMLMKCTRAGHLDCVKFLVERGVNINQGRDDEDEEMEEVEMKEEELPFHGRVFVCTGILKWASATLARLIQRCGGKLVQAVSGNVTHCICGKDGLTEWGQKTGIGSVKYKECKKRKIPFLPESAVDEALAKLPKYLSHADQLNAVVVGTVLHDFMQHAGLHEDETEDGVVRNKAVETILYLVDHGADLNFEDEDGELPLNVFVRCRNEGPSSCRVLKAVLDVMSAHTECKIDHKVSSQYQMTALQYCVVNHKHLFAKCLIEAWKYDINITSIIPLQRTGGKDSPFIAHAGENILHILTRRGAAELVEVVLKVAHDRNLQINVPKQGIEVNLFKADQKPELPDEGWSPLHLAARDLQGETQAVILKHFAEYPEIMFDFPTTDSKQLTVAHLLYMNWHTPHCACSVGVNQCRSFHPCNGDQI